MLSPADGLPLSGSDRPVSREERRVFWHLKQLPRVNSLVFSGLCPLSTLQKRMLFCANYNPLKLY